MQVRHGFLPSRARRSPVTLARFTEFPVEYPTACSPQASATGAPLLLMRGLPGLEPHDDRSAENLVLPTRIGELAVRGLSGPNGTYDAVAAKSPIAA
jgi:hypothetical protein